MNDNRHADWLSLIEYSGPFLAIAVLDSAFPQGLDVVPAEARAHLRSAYDEWRDAVDEADPQLEALHREWVRLVLTELLECDGPVLKSKAELDSSLTYASAEHGEAIAPDFAVVSEGKARLLISVQPPGTDLEAVARGSHWVASPIERTTLLCRACGVRIGLVTDGERWTLVNAPASGTTGHASWYARLWRQEPVTQRAFASLLGVRRAFGPPDATLEALLEDSLKYQEEVTDTLGEQVRRAVEVLIQALDRADVDRNRDLLRGVTPGELYEAGLTVMMRLVFVLCAEERGLLLLGDPVYDQSYAISTIRASLKDEEGRSGPEILERRHDAWSRLLAVFRAVYGGIEHQSLRLPALGGSLFDPDRFPFLEGRAKGSSWRDTPAVPLPIDNRTVLLLLTALQVLEQSGGAVHLSYKALDVEQIGHVYEGLLEHTVARMPGVTLGLVGSQKARNPTVGLSEMESARLDGEATLLERLKEVTGRSESALRNALRGPIEEGLAAKVLHVCAGDTDLASRLRPFANLLRTDNWGDPLVYRKDAFAVTLGADRRDTGTHYTPRFLAENIVATTLEPVVYEGPAEGKPREEWRLKSSAELLDLKVCDPAMGSGAFLVQACRWIAGRLTEAWGTAEAGGKTVTVDGAVYEESAGHESLPKNVDERLLIARRLVAERCLYGVDINPLAVELAKLSIWLVTLAKGRPFGFLDHNLRSGDSLLGIQRLDQLTELTMTPGEQGAQMRVFGQNIRRAVSEATELRLRLRQTPIRDIRDVQAMERLDNDARSRLKSPEDVADAFIGEVFSNANSVSTLRAALNTLAIVAQHCIDGDAESKAELMKRARVSLAVDLPVTKLDRRPFHWPLEFPEVFDRDNGGFDAMVGNPPFLGGQKITGAFGTAYRQYLVAAVAEGSRGSADLVAYFFLRAYHLLRARGSFGLLAVNTISEGDTRQVGLERLLRGAAAIYAAYPDEAWPGKAAVVTSRIHLYKGDWAGPRLLSNKVVSHISAFLSDQNEWSPKPLRANQGVVYQGSIALGLGFTITHEEALSWIDGDPRNSDVLFPYLNGDDLNSHPEQKATRWVICFWDWPLERAQKYEAPYAHVVAHVQQERSSNADRGARERWWQFLRPRSELYHAIGRGHHFQKHPKGWSPDGARLAHVLAITRHSKTGAIAPVSPDGIFSDATVVFAESRWWRFACLQSSIHLAWAWKQGSALKHDLRYTPTDVYESFPFPLALGEIEISLDRIGERLHAHRAELMLRLQVGLTSLYEAFHDPAEREEGIAELRQLHRKMDEEVLLAYGWTDVGLEHGFHDVEYLPAADRRRFTICETARIEILRRLSLLNMERHVAEDQIGARVSASKGKRVLSATLPSLL